MKIYAVITLFSWSILIRFTCCLEEDGGANIISSTGTHNSLGSIRKVPVDGKLHKGKKIAKKTKGMMKMKSKKSNSKKSKGMLMMGKKRKKKDGNRMGVSFLRLQGDPDRLETSDDDMEATDRHNNFREDPNVLEEEGEGEAEDDEQQIEIKYNNRDEDAHEGLNVFIQDMEEAGEEEGDEGEVLEEQEEEGKEGEEEEEKEAKEEEEGEGGGGEEEGKEQKKNEKVEEEERIEVTDNKNEDGKRWQTAYSESIVEVSVWNTFEDIIVTQGEEIMYDAGGPKKIMPGPEFPRFPKQMGRNQYGLYKIDVTNRNIAYTLINNTGVPDLVFPDGTFDRYYFEFGAPILAAEINEEYTSIDVTVEILDAGYVFSPSSSMMDPLGSEETNFPDALVHGGILITVTPGADLTFLGQYIVVGYLLEQTEQQVMERVRPT